jgi:prefoldin beta subunit
MSGEIPPQMQNQIAQLQQLQQQLQVIATQRAQLEAKEREIEATLEELKNTKDDTPVYKSIGTLLIKADSKQELEKELDEHKETIGVRVKTLKKQETTLSERYQSLGEKLNEALQGTKESS